MGDLPVLKKIAKESDDKNESALAVMDPEKYTWGDEAWNPTPTWGTVYNYPKEYRDKEKQEAKEWSDRSEAAQRKSRDDAMSGGRSPPRKDAGTKGKFLDEVDNPHGEMRRHECSQAVEERKAEKDDGTPTSIWGRPALREGQSAWRAFQPWESLYSGGRSPPPLEERNESSSRETKEESYLDPWDIPPPPFDPPKPKSIGIIVSGGDDYRTKEVKIVRRERVRKQSHRVITCISDRCTNDFCVLEKKEAATDKRAICVEVTLDAERRDCGG